MREDGVQYRRNRVHLRKDHRVSQSSSLEKSIKSPLAKGTKVNLPIGNDQLQHHETTKDNYETLNATCETASPVKTRAGRIIRK